ncbi:MAG: MarR family winged helix-turn-helix transcriptional regulator [Chloroflexota bacterium]|nr:MarR family winged helix-turn-helix transcriptional regulator [Chloroflexota bacterium]
MTVRFVFADTRIEAWALLHQTANLILKCEEAEFIDVGATPQQYWVLAAVKYLGEFRDGPVTQKDVAQLLDRNPNSITLIIDRMEQANLVERKRDLPDRRSIRLLITEKGEEIVERAKKPSWNLIEKMTSSLSEEDLQRGLIMMRKVRESAIECLGQNRPTEDIRLPFTAEDFDF